MEQPHQAVSEPDFESEAAEVLRRFQSALERVVQGLSVWPARAADLQRALRINMKLSWQISKVLGASDPLAIGHHFPSRTNLRAFLRAARKSGVAARLVRDAEAAGESFDGLVKRHADDREAFDSMVSGLAQGEAADRIAFQHRRAAFRANRHICGVEASTLVKCVFIEPASDPTMLDIARIEGFVQGRQLRRSAPLFVSWVRAFDDDGTTRHTGKREPLDVNGPTDLGVALLRDFCTQPLPDFRAMQAEGGILRGEVVPKGVGNAVAVTCYEGHIARAVVPRYREPQNRHGANVAVVRIPSTLLVLDLFVREGTFGQIAPVALVYADHLSLLPFSEGFQRPDGHAFRETVRHLERGRVTMGNADVPRYADMIDFVLGRLGWGRTDFDLFRCRIEYPIVPSTVAVRFDLPERP